MNSYLIAMLHTQLMAYIKVKTGVKHDLFVLGIPMYIINHLG